MNDCRTFKDLIEEYLDGTIGEGRLEELKAHMAACKTCAEEYDVVPILIGLDIDVKLMGEPLTRLLKNPRCRVMTF